MKNMSPDRMDQWRKCQEKRHPVVQMCQLPVYEQINPIRYCLAVLTEGMCETQARRFLAKINVSPIRKNAFYDAQTKLGILVEQYIRDFLQVIRENLSNDTIFGLDCSWSARRNAAHAIVVFMDVRTKLIFDFVIVSRDPSISDIEFNDSSNMMENAAVNFKKEEYSKNYKFVGFVHDFDVDTAPALQPDDETGQLIEYLDPGHLKKVVENRFKTHNEDNLLFQLKDNIIKRFNYIVRNQDLTVEQKVKEWHDTPNFIITNCKKKGYLIQKSHKRRVSPQTAKNALEDFLRDTEWIIRKCGVCDTQAVESFNSIKAKICPKSFHFRKAFRIRCLLAILKWNDKDYFEILDDKILVDQLNEDCKNVLENDKKALERWRNKSKEIEVRISRNIKRRNARIKNKIDPKGHQYLNDETEKKKRTDPTREVALIKLPSISNFMTSNCFINSFLQIFRHTKIDINFSEGKNTSVYQLMKRLNNGENLVEEDIADHRLDIIPTFSLSGQEDVAEYYNFVLNSIFTEETKEVNDGIIRLPQELNFSKAYKYTLKTEFECKNCGAKCHTFEDGYILEISIDKHSFFENLDAFFTDDIQRSCQYCNKDECHFTKLMVNSPEFLVIQLMRFSYKPELAKIKKDLKIIDIPNIFYSNNLHETYKLFGIIYHIGDECKSGHYIAKRLTFINTVETYDDSRCYLNPIDHKLPNNNAYLIFFQKCSSYIQDNPSILKKDDMLNEINQKIEKLTQENKISFEISCENNNLSGQNEPTKITKIKQSNKPKNTGQIEFQKIDQVISEKIKNFFKEYSYITSLYVFDQMMNMHDPNYFALMLQRFFDELISFKPINSDILLEFTIDFKNSKIIKKPVETIVKFYLTSIYNQKNDKYNADKTVIIFLHNIFEKQLISLKEIIKINKEVSKNAVNQDLSLMINNLEECFESFNIEASLNQN